MIIKRIKSIKNFGVFNNYRIGGNTRDFNERNIIYGWNYSRKTTLSRLFYFLNKEVEIPAENSFKEIQVIAELEWSKKSINDLMENCQQEFSSLLVKYDKLKKDYISILNLLQHDLTIKSSNSLFIKQELSIIDSTCIKELRKWIIDMQNIFSVHNKTISDFKSIRDNARNTYKKYLVAQILIDENYYETKRLKQCEERFSTRCKNIINNIKTEN